jgi:hypothetical protein
MKSPKLVTEVVIAPSVWKIKHSSKIITLGSCFAEVLGNQLTDNKFSVLNNPFGTVFNPLTIAKLLDMALEEKSPDPALYFQDQDGIWLHHDFHSSLWSTDKSVLENLLASKLREVNLFLKSAHLLVITFGSAYAYRHRASNLVIGNCHKVPSEKFLKELLNQDQMMISLESVLLKLILLNRNIKVLVTVSPVRHTRDTLVLNQLSKSTLRLVSHRLSERFKQVEYFPAYEIMVDELRDYRFYHEDLIHPNALAEGHIFSAFAGSFIEPASVDFMKEWQALKQMIGHKPQHGFTPGYFQLLKLIQTKLTSLAGKADLSAELEQVARRIDEFPALLQTS